MKIKVKINAPENSYVETLLRFNVDVVADMREKAIADFTRKFDRWAKGEYDWTPDTD